MVLQRAMSRLSRSVKGSPQWKVFEEAVKAQEFGRHRGNTLRSV